MVVTTTNVTTTLPNIVTTSAPLPIVNMPVGNVLSNLSTVLDVVRVPPNVPITAINIGTTRGTTVLTTRVVTLTSRRITRGMRT